MRNNYVYGWLLTLVVAFSQTVQAQTVFDITTFNTENLDGNLTLEICPGSVHTLQFIVTSGQINPFAVVDVVIEDELNPVNPINGNVVGSFANGATAIAAPSAAIPIDVTMPIPANTSDYRFYLQAAAAGVTPSPAQSDTVTRSVIPNPRSQLILDTSMTTYTDNIFKTDSSLILESFTPGLGPTFGGVVPIPPSAVPVPDAIDSTINFCNGDSLYLWNPDSLTANRHRWLLNGAPFPTNTNNQGHIWVYQSGYYSLITERANTCEDSAAYIGVGRPNLGGAFTAGVKGVYFHAYEVDTTLIRTGVGNAVGSPLRFCQGDSVVLEARQTSSHPLGFYEYQWVANGTDSISTDYQITVKQPGTFEVYVTEVIDSSFRCTVLSNLVNVSVDPLPASEVGTAASTLCFGDTLVVQDTNVYQPSNIYTWFANGTNLLGVFGDTNLIEIDTTLLSTLGIGADTSLYISLRVTDTLGCDSLSSQVLFDFQLYPEIALSTPDTFGLCLGDTVLVSAFTANGVSSTFTWFDFPGNNVVSPNANFNVGSDGTYYVEAIGPNGCTKYDTLFVFDLTIVADAGPNQTVDSGQVVQLGATGGVDYYWYAGSPVYFNNPFDQNAQTIPTQDTTVYYVEVTGANGCSDIDSMFVFVNPPPVIPPDPLEPFSNVQNVVTPNGDGVNDALDLSGVTAGDVCEFRLINRWGARVYLDPSYNHDWEGQDDGGNPLPDGTYYYTLRCPGDDFRIKGAVTIIRSDSN